jgi:hypothetical protein
MAVDIIFEMHTLIGGRRRKEVGEKGGEVLQRITV